MRNRGAPLHHELVQGHAGEKPAEQALGVAPDGREAAGSSARARLGAIERGGAARDDDGALHRLNELEQGGLARVHGKPHAARGAARVLDDPREGEVVINDAYREMAAHYGAAVMPARVRRPRDKPSVENEVWQAATEVIAALRETVFTDFGALKEAVRKKVDEHN